MFSDYDNYNYSLFVEGLTDEPFEAFLEREKPDYLFVTAISATFHSAVKFAKIAKRYECIVILGGAFATLNSRIIFDHYKDFDLIVEGIPPSNVIDKDAKQRRIIRGSRKPDIDYRLSDLLNKTLFDIYNNDPVCYDLGFGCSYECRFCTMRYIWESGHYSYRSIDNISYDLGKMNKWKSLKIIDDDILLSVKALTNLSLSKKFNKVIAETRVEKTDQRAVNILKQFGITHLMIGVESFDEHFLMYSLKYSKKNWLSMVTNAISSCNKEGIIVRPVLQLLHPGMKREYLTQILPIIRDWRIENGIELFFVFFTPHPGLKYYGLVRDNYITNDLSLYDHFNPIYRPNDFKEKDIEKFIDDYNHIIEELGIQKFNGTIHRLGALVDTYRVFFQ